MKYWHVSDTDGSSIYEGEECPWSAFGPYESFREAKKDAIEFHKETINTAKDHIHNLKKLRKKDLI